MKTKLFLLILLNNILLLFVCKYYFGKKETVAQPVEVKRVFDEPVGIVDSGFDWSTAIVFTFINKSDQLMQVYIDNRKYSKGTKQIIDTGRMYLGKYKPPDSINYLKDEKEILVIIKFLKSWLKFNLKNFTDKNAYDYLVELKEKYKGKEFNKSQYSFILERAMDVENALELISKKYPELYLLAN